MSHHHHEQHHHGGHHHVLPHIDVHHGHVEAHGGHHGGHHGEHHVEHHEVVHHEVVHHYPHHHDPHHHEAHHHVMEHHPMSHHHHGASHHHNHHHHHGVSTNTGFTSHGGMGENNTDMMEEMSDMMENMMTADMGYHEDSEFGHHHGELEHHDQAENHKHNQHGNYGYHEQDHYEEYDHHEHDHHYDQDHNHDHHADQHREDVRHEHDHHDDHEHHQDYHVVHPEEHDHHEHNHHGDHDHHHDYHVVHPEEHDHHEHDHHGDHDHHHDYHVVHPEEHDHHEHDHHGDHDHHHDYELEYTDPMQDKVRQLFSEMGTLHGTGNMGRPLLGMGGGMPGMGGPILGLPRLGCAMPRMGGTMPGMGGIMPGMGGAQPEPDFTMTSNHTKIGLKTDENLGNAKAPEIHHQEMTLEAEHQSTTKRVSGITGRMQSEQQREVTKEEIHLKSSWDTEAKFRSTSDLPGINWDKSAVVLITGASQNIGAALALLFAEKLGPVSLLLLSSRSKVRLTEVAENAKAVNGDMAIQLIEWDLTKPSNDVFKADLIEGCHKNAESPAQFEQAIIIHNAASPGDMNTKVIDMNNTEELQKHLNINLVSMIVLNSAFFDVFDAVEKRFLINMTAPCAVTPLSCFGFLSMVRSSRQIMMSILAKETPDVKVLQFDPVAVDSEGARAIIDTAHDIDTRIEINSFYDSLSDKLTPQMVAQTLGKMLEQGTFESGSVHDVINK